MKQQLVLLLLLPTVATFTGIYSRDSVAAYPSFKFQTAQFDELYSVAVSKLSAYIFQYSYNHSENSIIRITTSLQKDPAEEILYKYPLLIVIRQQKAVQSWQLPLPISYVYTFDSVSRFLCPEAQEVNTSLPMTVEVNTFAPENVTFQLKAEILQNFTISIGKTYDVYVSPSTPSYYQYTFGKDESRSVTLLVESDESYCAHVSIQAANCPVADLLNTVEGSGTYETVLTKGALTIQRPDSGNSVYIVFVLSPSDFLCNNRDKTLPIGTKKIKHIRFHIEGHIEDTVYVYAMLAGFGYSFMFYLSFFIVLGVYKLRNRNTEDAKQERNQRLRDDVALRTTPTRSYGSITSSEMRNNGSSDASTSEEQALAHSESVIEDADYLDDAEEYKDVYRAKNKLMVTDMARKSRKSLEKKYKLYSWNVVTVAIFYCLPVVQLVLTYQQVLNLSGDEDLCYYNFLCSRRLGVLHNFNNVFSNLGYVLLGTLFLFVTFRRQKKMESLPTEIQENYGIPQQLGLFFAMGWALITEGVMSGCYHVCPSYVNFQFDTSFMYILSGLLMLRLFQSRHPDINVNAHVAFLCIAAVIGLAVIGVVYNHRAFWIIFCTLYAVVVLFLSVQIYFVGRFKLREFCSQCVAQLRLGQLKQFCACSKPQHVDRFILLSLMNILNWALSLYGAVTKPDDFATFVLAIFIMNLMIYSIFYILMKLLHKERLSWPSIMYLVLSIIFWAPAMYFFTDSLTNWEKTPAQSRDLNAPCLILNFFDGHDVWHFLSAGALLSTFLTIFHIDDDLIYKPREEIPVF